MKRVHLLILFELTVFLSCSTSAQLVYLDQTVSSTSRCTEGMSPIISGMLTNIANLTAGTESVDSLHNSSTASILSVHLLVSNKALRHLIRGTLQGRPSLLLANKLRKG